MMLNPRGGLKYPAGGNILGAAALAGSDTGWRSAGAAAYNTPGGSYTGTTTVRGETVEAIFWDAPDMLVLIAGSGKEAWFSGQLIRIDGTSYPFINAGSFGSFTFGRFGTSNLFTAGNNYTIAWV